MQWLNQKEFVLLVKSEEDTEHFLRSIRTTSIPVKIGELYVLSTAGKRVVGNDSRLRVRHDRTRILHRWNCPQQRHCGEGNRADASSICGCRGSGGGS